MGGVKRFSADNDRVTKWTMGRADQAQKLNSLLLMCLWPSQILKSESRRSNVVAVLENQFVNPFDTVLDRTMLINLSSGSEVESPTKLVNLQKDGITIAKEFFQERLQLLSKKFFDSIPRNINKSTMVKKGSITKKNSLTTAEVNRDVTFLTSLSSNRYRYKNLRCSILSIYVYFYYTIICIFMYIQIQCIITVSQISCNA